MENLSSFSLAEVSSVTQTRELPLEEGEITNANGGLNDLHTQSVRSASSSSSSVCISAEAEKAPLMARAANLQEKQATKEEEQMLRKRRETLEWYMKLAATTAKSKRDWNVNA